MKKLLLLLLSLFMVLSITACGSKEETVVAPEPEPEPVRYSDTFLLVTKDPSIQTVIDLAGKTVGYVSALDQDCMDYVKEQIETEINAAKGEEADAEKVNYYDYYYYRAAFSEQENFDAYIIEKDAHENLVSEYSVGYHPEDYTIIAEYQKPYYEEEVLNSSVSNSDLYTKPFATMITGIDGAADPDSNGILRNDVNHLIICDPVKNHVTIISFPRDSYIYNNDLGRRDKLTHHGILPKGNVENVKASIETLLDIEIPYYAQVSFSTFVNLINSMGGVRVDVPLDTYLDMDSNRNVKLPQEFPKGEQNLFGESALALARNRKYKNIYNSDQGRVRNQALIITSMMSKIINHPRIIDLAEWSSITLPYMAYYNFSDDQISVLFELARKFNKEGYTVDNYFLDGEGGYAGDMYVLKLYDSSISIAAGKAKLALTGTIDADNPYYEEILSGWINKGTGTYEVGYLGEAYELYEIYGIDKPSAEVVEDTVSDAQVEDNGETE